MEPTTVAAWLAVVGTAFGLFIQGARIVRDRNKERMEVKDALDKAPLVKEQLQLGNIGGAIEQLNVIIAQQAAHIQRQDGRIEELEAEVIELRAALRNKQDN